MPFLPFYLQNRSLNEARKVGSLIKRPMLLSFAAITLQITGLQAFVNGEFEGR